MRRVGPALCVCCLLALNSIARANSLARPITLPQAPPLTIHQASGSSGAFTSTLSARTDAMSSGPVWSFKHIVSFSQGNPFCKTPPTPSPSSVPESSTFVLFAMGLVGISCLHSRKRSQLV